MAEEFNTAIGLLDMVRNGYTSVEFFANKSCVVSTLFGPGITGKAASSEVRGERFEATLYPFLETKERAALEFRMFVAEAQSCAELGVWD